MAIFLQLAVILIRSCQFSIIPSISQFRDLTIIMIFLLSISRDYLYIIYITISHNYDFFL